MAGVRFTVPARDRHPLAVWVEGDGPPLVMVHGSIADHTTFASFIDVLRQHFQVFAMDRRGFGATPDSDDYTLQREFEDVAAVTDAVAQQTGRPVILWGHSYGAGCAMGGATVTNTVSHLILYEPGLGLPTPPEVLARVEDALERGDHDSAIATTLTEALGMTEEELDGFRANPLWPNRLAAAPTIPRETRVEDGWVYTPGQFDAVTASTLFLLGSESVADVVRATERAAAAIRGSRIHLLEGQGHFAHRTDPEMVCSIVREFSQPG